MDYIRQDNNHAVCHFQRKEYGKAKDCVTAALGELRVQNDLAAKACHSFGQYSNDVSASTCIVRFHAVPGGLSQGLDEEKSEKEDLHFFSQPIIFDFTGPLHLRPKYQETIVSNTQRAACSAACLYNLGLLNHMEYFSTQDSKCLLKARQLYESAYYILMKMADIRTNDSSMIVFLAVTSNLASVFNILGDLANLREWKHQLRDAFDACCLSVIQNEEMAEFFCESANLPDLSIARAA